MKSIEDTLRTIRGITSALPVEVDIVLVGGVAAILHGVERTTIDVDFCVYSEVICGADSSEFFRLLNDHLPGRFSARLIQGGRFPDDPFKHDIIFMDDNEGEYVRIDFLIAQYKWELEGMNRAVRIENIPFPVLSKPYLAAMKLQAAGYKAAADIVALMELMTGEEKTKTFELAKRTHRDKKLASLLNPPPEDEVKDSPEEYL